MRAGPNGGTGRLVPLLILASILATGCELLVTFDPRDVGESDADEGSGDVEDDGEGDGGDDGPADDGEAVNDGDVDVDADADTDVDADDDGGDEVEDGGEESSTVCGNGTVEPPEEECELDDPARTCTTLCGPGTQACGSDCRWEACGTGDAETCNAADDDCDGSTDEDFACIQSQPSACATSCGSIGSTTCSATCTLGTCTPPPEVCNGRDDDCVGGPDDGFDCVAGATVACNSTCGTVGTGPCSSSCGFPVPADCTPPAESCNGADDDCDGQTDEGLWAPGGSDVRVTTNVLDSLRPSLDWHTSTRQYGLVWEEATSAATGGDIYFTLLDDAGGDDLPTDAPVATAAGSVTHEHPTMVWSPGGNHWGIVWSRLEAGASELQFRWVSQDGVTMGGTVGVTSAAGISNEPALIWTGTEYGLTWNDARDGNRETYFVRLTTSGSKPGGTSDERLTMTSSCVSARPSVAWTGAEFGIAWYEVCTDPGDVWFTRVTAAGTEVAGAERGNVVFAEAQTFPRLVWNGTGYAMVWLDDRAGGNDQLYFARLNTDGVIIGSAAQLTTATETTGIDGYAALAWNGTRREYFVVWSDQRNAGETCGGPYCSTEIYFQRLDAAGTRIGTAARLTVAAGESTNPAIADDGTGYGVVWTDERDVPGAPEIYFNSVRCR